MCIKWVRDEWGQWLCTTSSLRLREKLLFQQRDPFHSKRKRGSVWSWAFNKLPLICLLLWLPDHRAPANSLTSQVTRKCNPNILPTIRILSELLGVFPIREPFSFELETKLGEGTWLGDTVCLGSLFQYWVQHPGFQPLTPYRQSLSLCQLLLSY